MYYEYFYYRNKRVKFYGVRVFYSSEIKFITLIYVKKKKKLSITGDLRFIYNTRPLTRIKYENEVLLFIKM